MVLMKTNHSVLMKKKKKDSLEHVNVFVKQKRFRDNHISVHVHEYDKYFYLITSNIFSLNNCIRLLLKCCVFTHAVFFKTTNR